MSGNILNESVECPKCSSILELSEDERENKKVFCPECEAQSDFNFDPPKIIDKESFVQILESLNQGDIALIKSLLEDAEVEYYILGENFLGVRPLLEPARIFVLQDKIPLVKELLKDFELHIFGVSTNQSE